MKSVLVSQTPNKIEWQSAYVTVGGSINAGSIWFDHLDRFFLKPSQNVGAARVGPLKIKRQF
jgi:hypothetical protein